MNDLSRRQFIQSASLIVAGGCSRLAFGAPSSEPPKFADVPTFRPSALFLTWQRDPTTTMTVQWVGSEAEGAQRPVWFAKKGSQQWRNEGYTTRRFPISDQWIHRAELTTLEPDTDYVFRVGTDSAEQAFRTAPAKDTNAIQFVSGGDSGVGTHPRQINRLAAAQEPLFALLGGDLAYENGNDPFRFLEFLENYSNDLRIGAAHGANGCLHRQPRGRWQIRTAAKAGALFLFDVRRLVSRNRLRDIGFRPIHVAGVARHKPHLSD